MAKKGMLKLLDKWMTVLVSLIVALAIASGVFVNVVLVSLLPLTVHQVIGYATVALIVLKAFKIF